MAVATIARAVISGRDHIGADRSEHAGASAHGGIPIAAITANPGYLGRRLIENPDVRLMSAGCRVSARLRHIDRRECRVAAVDQTPGKITVPAIAGAVISRVDRERLEGIRTKPRRNWRLAPEHILSIQVKAVRYIPKIHGRCPLPKSIRADWTGASRHQERMSPPQARSRVVNSDCECRAINMISVTPIRVRGRPYTS